ncbi:MAG: PfkB family carbohydrate kinase, partial [Thermoproteota archaeon]
IVPLAIVITPNIPEAERLSGISIKSIEDAKEAALRISRMGAEAVVVKGGHMGAESAVDVLYHEGGFRTFESPPVVSKTTHGTGCSFSAAIAAGLAKKMSIPESVGKAKEVVTLGIRFGLRIGKGNGPVNPMAHLYRESSRIDVLKSLERARMIVESSPGVVELIPEVGMNIAMAIPYAETPMDVAAFPGRIVRHLNQARAVGCPAFGASRHLARYLLSIRKYDPDKSAAANLRYSEEVIEALRERRLKISFYDRSQEPEDVKRVEGMTIPWGVEQAVGRIGSAPDVIYHTGDIGKEPMIVVFRDNAEGLALLIVEVSRKKSSI